MLLFGGLSPAVAQFGRPTGAVPGFPQFYESFVEEECNASNVCDVRLGLVPTNRLLMATDITCHAFATDDAPPGTRGRFRLREEKAGTETPKNVFSVGDISPPSGAVQREHALNASLQSFFAPGSRPTISYSAGGIHNPNSLACKLSGSLVRRQ